MFQKTADKRPSLFLSINRTYVLFIKMLTIDQRKEKISTQSTETFQNFLLENSGDVETQIDPNTFGVLPPESSDSTILNIPSQVHQGLDWLREFAQELSKNLTKGNNTRGQRGANPVPENVAVPLLELMARQNEIPHHAAILGFAEDGSTIIHRFTFKETPHLLIVGGPDSGKTVMLRSIAASLALNNRQSEIQVAVISPINGDDDRQRNQAEAWYALNYLPHMLCDVAFRYSDIVDLLTFLNNEISYREANIFKNPHLIILIDDADILIERGGRRCAEPILRLAQKGEEVGIHLVLSVQSLETKAISIQLQTEIPTRVIGRPASELLSHNFPLKRDEDIEQLLGEGDFLYQQNGHKLRMQGAFIGDQDLLPKLVEMNRTQAILLAEPVQSRLRLEQPDTKTRIKWSPDSANKSTKNGNL